VPFGLESRVLYELVADSSMHRVDACTIIDHIFPDEIDNVVELEIMLHIGVRLERDLGRVAQVGQAIANLD
jgi:hypothetical protein